MRGIPFLYLTDNRPDFSGRLFLYRGTLAIAERLGRFSSPKRGRNGIMDLLHFKISEYGISIASRIPGTEISLNNSDEYFGAGFLKTDFRHYFIVNFQNFSQDPRSDSRSQTLCSSENADVKN